MRGTFGGWVLSRLLRDCPDAEVREFVASSAKAMAWFQDCFAEPKPGLKADCSLKCFFEEGRLKRAEVVLDPHDARANLDWVISPTAARLSSSSAPSGKGATYLLGRIDGALLVCKVLGRNSYELGLVPDPEAGTSTSPAATSSRAVCSAPAAANGVVFAGIALPFAPKGTSLPRPVVSGLLGIRGITLVGERVSVLGFATPLVREDASLDQEGHISSVGYSLLAVTGPHGAEPKVIPPEIVAVHQRIFDELRGFGAVDASVPGGLPELEGTVVVSPDKPKVHCKALLDQNKGIDLTQDVPALPCVFSEVYCSFDFAEDSARPSSQPDGNGRSSPTDK
jgi:hypothetical protein